MPDDLEAIAREAAARRLLAQADDAGELLAQGAEARSLADQVRSGVGGPDQGGVAAPSLTDQVRDRVAAGRTVESIAEVTPEMLREIHVGLARPTYEDLLQAIEQPPEMPGAEAAAVERIIGPERARLPSPDVEAHEALTRRLQAAEYEAEQERYPTEPLDEPPVYAQRLVQPWVARAKQIWGLVSGGEFRGSNQLRAAVQAELQYRLASGLYDPQITKIIEWDEWYRSMPETFQARMLADGTVDRKGGSSFVDTHDLERKIHEEIQLGLPLVDEEALEHQSEFYRLLAQRTVEALPPARGFEKLFQAVGDISVFAAEFAAARRMGALRAPGRAAVRGARLDTAMTRAAKAAEAEVKRTRSLTGPAMQEYRRLTREAGIIEEAAGTATFFGARAATEPGGQPAKEAVVGVALGTIGRGVRGRFRRAAATGGLFAGVAAAEGGEWLDVLIAGVVAPLLFHGRDLLRYPFRPRGLAVEYGGSERIPNDWRDIPEMPQGGGMPGRLILRWMRMAEEARADDAEIRATGQAIQRLYERSRARNFEDLPADQAALLRGFVAWYHPEQVSRRAAREETTGERRKTVEKPAKTVEKPGKDAVVPVEPTERSATAAGEKPPSEVHRGPSSGPFSEPTRADLERMIKGTRTQLLSVTRRLGNMQPRDWRRNGLEEKAQAYRELLEDLQRELDNLRPAPAAKAQAATRPSEKRSAEEEALWRHWRRRGYSAETPPEVLEGDQEYQRLRRAVGKAAGQPGDTTRHGYLPHGERRPPPPRKPGGQPAVPGLEGPAAAEALAAADRMQVAAQQLIDHGEQAPYWMNPPEDEPLLVPVDNPAAGPPFLPGVPAAWPVAITPRDVAEALRGRVRELIDETGVPWGQLAGEDAAAQIEEERAAQRRPAELREQRGPGRRGDRPVPGIPPGWKMPGVDGMYGRAEDWWAAQLEPGETLDSVELPTGVMAQELFWDLHEAHARGGISGLDKFIEEYAYGDLKKTPAAEREHRAGVLARDMADYLRYVVGWSAMPRLPSELADGIRAVEPPGERVRAQEPGRAAETPTQRPARPPTPPEPPETPEGPETAPIVGEPGTQGVLGGEVGEAVRLAAVARWRRILQLAVDYAAEEALYDPPVWGDKLRDALGESEYDRLFDADRDLRTDLFDVSDVYLALRRQAFAEISDWPETLSVMRAREAEALDRLRAGERGIIVEGEPPPRVPKAARGPISDRIREAARPIEAEPGRGAEPVRREDLPPAPGGAGAGPGASGPVAGRGGPETPATGPPPGGAERGPVGPPGGAGRPSAPGGRAGRGEPGVPPAGRRAVPGERPPAEPGVGRGKPTARTGREPGVGEPGPGRRGGEPAPAPREAERVEAPGGLRRDYVITPDVAGELFAGGEKTWADDNLRAIELLKRIQAEQRPATPQEADVLVRYKGWGSVKGVFSIREEWAELKERLEGLLTRDEADAAANASLNAMYSPPDVVGAMWDALRRFGFTGGRVLEPAAGVGHFYGLMPADMRAATRRVAVELDPISGGILRLLYPDTDVRIAGFQEAALPNEAFDLVISNVPFGDYGVFDRHYPAAITGKIHDYFFVRAADLLRPHAVMAFITSHGTLDKLNAHVRNVLAEKLDFLGAIRLNDSSLPRTKVIADIIFFRRRARGDPLQTEPRWRESREVEVVPGGPYRDPVMRSWNEYYHDHPEMVLGKVELGSQYGPSRGPTDITVRPSSEAPLGDQLRAAVARLPENVMELAEDRPAIPEPLDLIPSPENLPGRGELALIDGGLHRNTEEGARNIEAELMAARRRPRRTLQRVKGVIGLRDRLLRLLREQLQAESEEEYASQLDDLRQAYDKFVRKNRGVRTAANMRPFRTLGDLWTPTIVAGLEEVDPGTGETRPGPVFTRRVLDRPAPITRVDTPTDAIPVLLNESGGLDRRRLAELTALPEQHAVAELVEAGAAYEDPSGRLVVAEEYLSGDVVGKLQAARAAAELDARYRANVLALEKVQPQPLEAEEIDVSLGAPWVPAEVVENFVDELIGDDAGTRNLQIRYSPEAGRWLVGDANYIAGSVIGREEWGTPDVPMPRLVSDTLNVITPTVKRTVTQPDGSEKREVDWPATEEIRAKQKELQTRWRDWIWADAGRIERLVPLYNETYNNLVPRRYDGSWLTFPTMAPWARDALRDFQRRSVARILHDRRALLFHAPGAGKTWVMVAGAVEGRRLGTIRKSIIVVPRQVLDQAADTARALYPAGRFLLVQPEDLAPRKIDGTLVQMALGETWDAILMTKEGFKRIPMSRANVQEYLGKRLAELEQAITDATEGQVDRNQIRRMRTARMNLDTRLLRMLADVEQHEGLTFEQLGVDMVMYDESQYAKNAPFTTQMERVRGLGNSQGNELTFDLMMKGLYLSRLHNGAGGMVFSSGTPVTNSIVEMYTLMRYLSPMELEADGINHLDGWVQQFGEITEEAERKAYGKYVPESRLRRFKNVSPELLTRFWRFADVVTFDELAEILGSNIPKIALNSKGERTWEDVILESTVHHRRVFRGLQQTAQWIKEHYRAAMEQGMPMLTVYTDMRKAGIDLRYLDPSMPDLPGSKLSVAAGKIAEIYHRTAKDRLTQAVFLNMGIPSPEARAAGEFIPYDELLRKLLLLEVNPAEIAMMPDYGLKQLPELFARVNAGEIRVLIGSLERMGVGVNIQQRLIAEHLLDPPYRPDLVEQGLRRGVRHGNINPEVELYRYATKGSGDEDMYFINATKWAFYNQLMRGDLAVRAFDDLQTDTMSFAQISAAVSENPVIRELIEAQHELQRLQHLEVAHVRAQRRLAQEIRSREAEIGHAGELQAMHAEIARLAKVEPFGVVVAGRRCHKHKETGEALKRHAMAPEWTRAADRWDPIGELLGVPLLARPVFSEPGHRRLPNAMQVLFEPERSVRPGAAVQLGLDTNPTFLATGLAAVVKRSAGEEAAAQERMELLGREQSAAQGRIGLPFGEREALAEQARVVGDLERQVQSYEDSQGEPDGLERYASPVVDDVRSALAQSSAAYQALEDELAELETAEPLTDPWKEDPMAHRGWQERMANLSDQMDTLVLEELHRRDGAGEADVPKEDPEPFSVAPVAPAAHPRVRSASRRSDRIAYYMRHGLGVELPPEMERHIRTSDAPAFGMGAMAVIPDPRNPWKRTFDRIRDRMLSLPRGSRRHAFVNYVGRGLWGLRFGVGDEQWIRLSRVPGAWKLSSEDAGAINRRITDKMADLERHCGPEEAQATNQLLADVMDGVRPVEDLPPDLHDLYTTYKGIMDEMLDELEALTWLHPHLAAFGLRNVMDIIRLRRGGRGVYLRRLYQVGDPSRAGGEKEYRRGTTRRPNGRFRLMTNYRLRGGMWKHRRSDADSDLALWTVQHADGTFTQTPDPDAAMEVYEREIETNLKRYGQSVYDRVKLLDPFDQTVVEKLGPVRDVRVRIARTLTDMRHNLEVLKLFDYLDMTVALDQPPDDPAEDYERLMAHPTMGPLSGKWVPGPIAHALTAMERVNNSLPWQAWDLFNNSWKYGHVVVNLPTWMNNLFGLSYSWALDRLTPASDLRWFREAFIAMRDRTQPWRDLVAANRINVGFSHEIANAMLKQLEYGDRDLPSLLSEWIHNVARRAGLSEGQMAAMDRGLVRAKRGAATLGRLYDYPDQVSIMASYLKKRHEGMSHEEALRNLWMYPNYAEPGQYARWARKTPFGATFVMFTEQWAKISIKAMRNVPGTLLALYLLPGLLALFTRIYLGITDEEMAVINTDPRRSGSPWRRYMMPILPVRDREGRLLMADLRWKIPGGDDLRFLGLDGGLDIPWVLSTPATQLFGELASRRELYTGREIWKRTDSNPVKLWKGFKHVVKDVVPLPRMATHGAVRVMRTAEDGDFNELMRVLALHEWADCVWPGLTSQANVPPGTNERMERGYATYLMRVHVENELRRTLSPAAWARMFAPEVVRSRIVPAGTNASLEAGYQAYVRNHAAQQQMRSQAHRDQIAAGNLAMRGAELDFARQRAREEQALSRSLEEFAANVEEAVPPVPAPPAPEYQKPLDLLSWAERVSPGITLRPKVPRGTNERMRAGYQAYLQDHQAKQQQMRSQAYRDQISAGNLPMRGAELDFARQRAREEQALSRSLEEFAANEVEKEEAVLEEDVLQWAEMLLAFLEADLPSDPMLTREEFTRRIYPGPREKSLRA